MKDEKNRSFILPIYRFTFFTQVVRTAISSSASLIKFTSRDASMISDSNMRSVQYIDSSNS